MTTVVSLALTVVGFQASSLDNEKRFWMAALVAMALAAYRVWAQEHRKLTAANAQIVELRAPAGEAHRRSLRDEMLARLSPAELGFLQVLVLYGQAPSGPEMESIERKTEFARRSVRGTHFDVNPTFGPVLEEWLRSRKPL